MELFLFPLLETDAIKFLLLASIFLYAFSVMKIPMECLIAFFSKCLCFR